MPRLKDRNKQIPNGLVYYDPVTKYTAPRFASFSVICDGIRSARLANPGLTKSKGLATDPIAIADEVDQFNAAHCESRGWSEYITGASGGGPSPFQPAPHSLRQRVVNVAAGVEAVVEWVKSREDAVKPEQSSTRAAVCVKCPLNQKGDWTRFFTVPASNAIRAALRHKSEFSLTTPVDDQLGICAACDCPMTLKVHARLETFLPKMSQAAKDSLHPDCWIRAESK